MNAFFLVLLVLLVVMVVVFAVGATYITRHETQEREDFQSEARQRSEVRSEGGDGREFYKSLGLGTGEHLKVRLFTLEEYRDELGGDAGSLGGDGFVGALKAYRQLDGDWYDTPPEKAAEPLDLKEDEYRTDDERGVLLLKRLPPGVPASAKEHFEP